MSVKELLDALEITIKDAREHPGGDAALRTAMVYKHVVLYLIGKQTIKINDDAGVFWEYTKKFPMSGLYKVAEYQRKKSGLPPLNYRQSIYYISG